MGRHKYKSCMGTRDGVKCWVNLEPCGLICGMISWLLLFYGMYATTFCVLLPWLGESIISYINMGLFNGFSIMAIISHFRAMTTDPGSVPHSATPLPDDESENDYEAGQRGNKYRKFCKRCRAFKPIRAHHCSICGRCIVKMDHHCPWVNNCVGIGNHKLFLLFIFWTCIVCFYAIILIIGKYIYCISANDECGTPEQNLMVILLLVESILFGLFTLCMMGDQVPVITTNQTQIDKLKNQRHEAKVEINEVFGCPSDTRFRWDWLLPLPVKFPESVKDKLLGYRVDDRDESGEEMQPLKSRVTADDLAKIAMGVDGTADESLMGEMGSWVTNDLHKNSKFNELSIAGSMSSTGKVGGSGGGGGGGGGPGGSMKMSAAAMGMGTMGNNNSMVHDGPSSTSGGSKVTPATVGLAAAVDKLGSGSDGSTGSSGSNGSNIRKRS